MTPYFLENPYQAELAAALRAQNTAVSTHNGWWFYGDYVRSGANVLHLHWLQSFFVLRTPLRSATACVLFALQLALVRLRGGRIVWTVHNLKMHEPRYPTLDRIANLVAVMAADRLIIHCEWAKHEIRRRYPLVSESRLVVTPHASYLGTYPNTVQTGSARKLLGLKPDQTVLLFFGAVRPYKGVLELLDAFDSLRAGERVKLLIAGRPLSDTVALEVTHRARHMPNVHLVLQFIPDSDIQNFLNAADVIVLPYRDIFTSGAALLALSFGKPIVAPRIGCMAEVLTEDGAFLFKPDDGGGLEQALRRALQDQHRHAQMGQHNLQTARRLTWVEMANRTAAAYRECLA